MDGILLRRERWYLKQKGKRETMCSDSWSHHVTLSWQPSGMWACWLACFPCWVTPDWTMVNDTATPLCDRANL